MDGFPQSTFSDSNNIMTEGQGYAVIRYHGTAIAKHSEKSGPWVVKLGSHQRPS